MQPLLTSEPTTIGDYRLLARLGKGSMGAVYLARSRGGRAVAIKVSRSDLAEDPEFRERFRREIAMARSVGGFWTATVVDADPDAQQQWLATEYVPGPTLHRAVADHGPLPERTVRGLAAGLSEALGAVHRAGLVHRDLKPANILLGPDGPRVIDFGISRAMSAHTMTATGVFLGTPGFFSPEQTVGDEIGPPSDVFALGAVLTFASVGSGPFGSETTAAMLYRVVHAEPELEKVPGGLRPLVAACLSKNPQARPSPASILEQVKEPSPQGDQWLPPAITATITEHTAQLRKISSTAPEASPPAMEPKPDTRAYPEMQLAERPAPPAAPASLPATSDAKRNGKVGPACPKGTARRPVPPESGRTVREENPGPVFATKGRFRKILWVITVGLVVSGLHWMAHLATTQGHPLSSSGSGAVRALIALLLINGLWSLVRALAPALKLKINSDGLLVSRLGVSRAIPWSRVSRVGIVGRGKKQSVAVWVSDGHSAPSTTWWHRVHRYHGGVRMFPIGATGGWWARRQEARRVRLALQQYGGRSYDGRLL